MLTVLNLKCSVSSRRSVQIWTILSLLVALSLSTTSWAADSVTLEWDPNGESYLGGYNLYWGPSSGNYTSSRDVGDVTTYVLTGLQPGTYYFAVTAYDNTRTIESGYSNEESETITVDVPPVASFVATPTSGLAPLTVDFTNTSTGTIDTWSWSFGDTATSAVQNPTHNYTLPGTYTVNLTATGPAGTDSASTTIQVFASTTLADELVVDFSTEGTWHYGDSWTHLSTWDPVDCVAWEEKIVVAFGQDRGIYSVDSSNWAHLSGWDPIEMVAWENRLAVAFGLGRGLFTYDGSSWESLTTWDPVQTVAWGNKLAVAFGGGRGLYLYDSSGWERISAWDPYEMVAWGDQLVVAFDAGRGVFSYDGSQWENLSAWEPTQMVSWADKLAVAFGSNRGVWTFETSTAWVRLTDWDSYDLVAWGDKLAAAFDSGRGLWLYDGSKWDQVTINEPTQLRAKSDSLVTVLPGMGIYSYSGTGWDYLSSWEPEGMEPVNLIP